MWRTGTKANQITSGGRSPYQRIGGSMAVVERNTRRAMASTPNPAFLVIRC